MQPNYWTDVQKQADEIDELIVEFNKEVGIVVKQSDSHLQGDCHFKVMFYNKAMLKPTDLILVCLLADAAGFGNCAAVGMVPNPASHRAESCCRGLSGFLPTLGIWRTRRTDRIHRPGSGHELTTRGELLRDEKDHPRAKEEYYKIQLGGLEKLSEPIKTDKWKRLTFLYSTGEYLLNAKMLNDLVVQNEEREILWRSLRERAENEQLYKTDLPEADIPPEVLMALLGIKEVQADYDTKEQSNGNFD